MPQAMQRQADAPTSYDDTEPPLRPDGGTPPVVETRSLGRDEGGPDPHELIRSRHDADDERFRLTMELAPAGIAHVSTDGRYLDVNQAMCDLLGYSREELLERSIADVSLPDDIAVTDDVRARLHSGEISSFRKEKRYIRKDGTVVWVDLRIAVRRDDDGRVLYDISVVEDISARRLAEDALRESEARFKQLTELSSDWYWETDSDDRITRLEGRDVEELREYWRGITAEDLGVHPLADGPTMSDLLARREQFRDHLFTRRYWDRTIHITISGDPIFDVDGTFAGFRGVVRDVTRRIESEEQIRYLATHDGLTDLPNRVMFTELLEHAIASSQRHGRRLAVGFIDLDRFKHVNDSLGHAAGDRLLQDVARRLRRAVRESDVVARLGGDEFVVMVEECGSDQDVARIAAGLLDTVLEPIQLGEHEYRVSASIGIACFPGDGDDPASLMKHADLAMYTAKDAGKNRFRFYHRDITARSKERFEFEALLREALERGEFSMAYQPKFDTVTGALSGAEGLLRWNHPTLGTVPPSRFIPVAEEAGLIVPIGRWALETVCHQAAEWERQGRTGLRVSVNLSPRQFLDPGLLLDVSRVLSESGLAPHLLELELTESAVMPDPDQAAAVLRSIKEIGVRIALDDFGTGYSSLAQLRRFPLDTLKIDRSFVRDLPQSRQDQAITEAVIALGRTLGLDVIAEGVETEEQLAFLREHGCDAVQGYLLSLPLTAQEFTALHRDGPTSPTPTS